jgi:alanine racemase
MEFKNASELSQSGSVLLISSDAIKENLAYFKSKLNSKTLVMAMVKAVGYGHGATHIAKKLQNLNAVDYFGVANITKGIELRRSGIELPIMVTNPISGDFYSMCHFGLEPVLHNLELAELFSYFVKENPNVNDGYPVHIKFNTGMNRFGLDYTQFDKFISLSKKSRWKIKSVMTHLSCSDDPKEDSFTLNQLNVFSKLKMKFEKEFDHSILFHSLNSNGIIRFPEHQYDMVRLGVGLYGASEFKKIQPFLKPIAIFQTHLAQIRLIKKGESISYSRSGQINEDSYIGTLSVGYADGFPRSLGNGNWEIEIDGKLYPTIGNICMDYTMINLGSLKPTIKQEDIVTIFGGQKSIYDYANALDTICYEAMTNLGNRVQRVLMN